jgi:branched-chain amino acid transport system ATP-binding protein
MSALLEVSHLTRSFGAVRAVGDVSFTVPQGELLGLIGPNGAGKTTLFNIIAGALAPSSGTMFFAGRNVTGWKSYAMARIGVARTFQIPKPYRQLSVVENVMLSAFLQAKPVSMARKLAEEVLSEAGLIEFAASPVNALTTGFLKRLEVARALAARPKLVLFDEIMAGLTPAEVAEMTNLVATLPARGVTVIWVEHVLYAIMKTATRILVLDRGKLIADGPPEAVAHDPAVIKAYLGEGPVLA